MRISTAIRALALATVLTVPAVTAFAQAGSLTNPAALTEQAPATYKARFETSKGVFVVEVIRALAPRGADRFYNLVKSGYYDGVRFFRGGGTTNSVVMRSRTHTVRFLRSMHRFDLKPDY